MNQQQQINQSYDIMMGHLRSTKVLLLHPKSKFRTVLLAKLINDPEIVTYYYALGHDDINLRAFIESLTHDLATQHATFGRHLNMMPHEVYENFTAHEDDVLATFIKEIHELNGGRFVFILDEYDHSDAADDIHRFVLHLADHLPEGSHIVINSRTLPRLPWVAMVAKKQAVLLLDDNIIQRDFYEAYRGDDYDMRVFALGPGIVHVGETPIETWEGHLPRLLFFFALDRPVVTRSEICQGFWPDLESDQAVNVFHVTKRRLHKALDQDVLVHIESHYQINPELNVYYDVIDFVETLMRGRNPDNSDDARFEAWKQAAALYKGPFLNGHTDRWIVERRDAFRAGYLEALIEMADVQIARNKQEDALKLYLQALEEDFSREDIHRRLMQLYTEMGRRSEAVAHFNNVERIFKETSRSLSSATRQVYSDILV